MLQRKATNRTLLAGIRPLDLYVTLPVTLSLRIW